MNNRNDVSDLLAEADVGINSKRIVCCGESTLNTPYKDGLVSGSQGIAYINMANESYGTVMYIVCGGNEVFLKRKSGGTWDNNWQKLVTNADLPLTAKSWQLESGGGSDSFTYGKSCIIFVSRGSEYGVYMCDNWNAVAKIHEAPNINVSVSNHNVTVTNNRSAGAVNVIVISGQQTY